MKITKKLAVVVLVVAYMLTVGASVAMAAPRVNALRAEVTTYNGNPVFQLPPLTSFVGERAQPGDKATGSVTFANNTSVTYAITGYTIVPKNNNVSDIPRLAGRLVIGSKNSISAVITARKHLTPGWTEPANGFGYVFKFEAETGRSLSDVIKEKYGGKSSLLEIDRDTLVYEVFGGQMESVVEGTGPNDVSSADLIAFSQFFRPNGYGGYDIMETDPEMIQAVTTFSSREWFQFTLDDVNYKVNLSTTNTKPVFGKDYLDNTSSNDAMLKALLPVGTEIAPGGQLVFANAAISMMGEMNNIMEGTTIGMPFELYINLAPVNPPDTTYTVTYVAPDRDSGSPMPANLTGLTAGAPITVSGTVPTRSGYTFKGWTTNFDSNTYQPGGQFNMPAQNVVLTATWQILPTTTYTVTYVAPERDSGSPMPANLTGRTAGETIAVSSTVPTRSGYTFKGWVTSFNSSKYQPGGQFSMPGQNVVLTATWEKNASSDTSPGSSGPSSGSSSSSSSTSSSSSRTSSSSQTSSSSSSGSSSGISSAAEPPAPSSSEPAAPVSSETPPPAPSTPTAAQQVTGVTKEDRQRLEAQTGNPIVDIANGNVPLGGLQTKGAWSLLSLMFSIMALLSTAVLLINQMLKAARGEEEDDYAQQDEKGRKRSILLAIGAAVAGVLTPILFIILDNMKNPMVFINRWTLLVGCMMLVHFIVLVLRRLLARNEAPEETTNEG